MYLLTCAAAFATLSYTQRAHRKTWAVLAVVALAEWANAAANAGDHVVLQAWRSCFVFVGGCMMCYIKSTLSLYQAVVFLATLLAYLALAVDVYVLHAAVLIYDGYEGAIYGLVCAQFLGAGIGACTVGSSAGSPTRFFNLQNGERT